MTKLYSNNNLTQVGEGVIISKQISQIPLFSTVFVLCYWDRLLVGVSGLESSYVL